MVFEGFMYLDVDSPLVAWNTYRGVLVSQKIVQQTLEGTGVPALSMTAAKMFMDREWSRLRFEYELEGVRSREFPTTVSRLQCLFVFDEPESALAAASDENWGGHINYDHLTDVEVNTAPNRTRVDANWISWMLRMRHCGDDGWRSGIRPYWMGLVCPHFPHPIWEVLLDGTVTILGTALRQRAYDSLRERSPSTVSLLELSRLAAWLGSNLGHVSALVRTEKEKQVMSFFLDMRDARDTAFTDRVRDFIASNPDHVNFNDLAVGGDTFLTPNFILYSHVFGS